MRSYAKGIFGLVLIWLAQLQPVRASANEYTVSNSANFSSLDVVQQALVGRLNISSWSDVNNAARIAGSVMFKTAGIGGNDEFQWLPIELERFQYIKEPDGDIVFSSMLQSTIAAKIEGLQSFSGNLSNDDVVSLTLTKIYTVNGPSLLSSDVISKVKEVYQTLKSAGIEGYYAKNVSYSILSAKAYRKVKADTSLSGFIFASGGAAYSLDNEKNLDIEVVKAEFIRLSALFPTDNSVNLSSALKSTQASDVSESVGAAKVVDKNIKEAISEQDAVAKSVKAVTGISLKDIQAHGIAGGPNSEVRKIGKSLSKTLGW